MPVWNVPQEQIREDSAESSPTECSPRQMEAYNRVLRSVFFNEKKSELFPSYLEVISQWKIFDFSSIIIKTEKETEKNQDKNQDNNQVMKGREELLRTSSGSSVSVSLSLDEAKTLEKIEVEKEVEKEVVRLHQYPVGSSIESIVNSRI